MTAPSETTMGRIIDEIDTAVYAVRDIVPS